MATAQTRAIEPYQSFDRAPKRDHGLVLINQIIRWHNAGTIAVVMV